MSSSQSLVTALEIQMRITRNSWNMDEETYPSLSVLSEDEQRAFKMSHIHKHLSGKVGQLGSILEKLDHGGHTDQVGNALEMMTHDKYDADIEVYVGIVAKLLINTMMLADVLNIDELTLARRIGVISHFTDIEG